MERRKAVTAAAAVSLTMLAGAAGMTLNSSIVGARSNDGVGQLSPVGATTGPPATLFVDGETTSTGPIVTAPTVRESDAAPTSTSSASGHHDDDDDREHEDVERRHDDDRTEREHESGQEYEGHDDDD